MYNSYSGGTTSDSESASALEESHNADEQRLYDESDLLSAKVLPYQFEPTYSKKQMESNHKA